MHPGTLACTARQHWAGHVSSDPTDDLQRHRGLEVPAERVARADGRCAVVREEEREGLLRLPQPVGVHVFRTRVPTCAGYVETRNRLFLFCSTSTHFSFRIAGLGPRTPTPSLVMSRHRLAVPCATGVVEWGEVRLDGAH